MSLVFDIAAPAEPASPNRADVACFIGFVARRRGAPLPASVYEDLRLAGWARGKKKGEPYGPWAKGEDAVESLENLPVTVESWEAFAHLFAWDERAVLPDAEAGSPASDTRTCTTYLGAAVRGFFAHGGKRAVIVRVGDPWPFLEPSARRTVRRRERLNRLVPDFAERSTPAHPFDPTDPRSWRGMYHLYGLPEVSLLCMPDLPDACAGEPPVPATAVPPPLPPEGFVECSEDEPALPQDRGLRLIPAPRLDSLSFAPWRLAVANVRSFLARHRREVVFIAALPLPHAEARRVVSGGWVHAEADMLGFLRRAGVFETAGRYETGRGSPASAFVQFAYPWLCTRTGGDLPEGAEPSDGVLAGLLAANALERGTFRSAAGLFSVPRLNDVHASVPAISRGGGPHSPAEQLAQRVCLFAPTPDGIALQSDVTASPDPAWRFGGASRLMGTVLRAARRSGEAVLFEGNGPEVWSRVRRAMEELLEAFLQEGALAGASAAEAYSVRCDRSTMTQDDIDNGRLIVEISLRPAASIERITVRLTLAANGAGGGSLKAVA